MTASDLKPIRLGERFVTAVFLFLCVGVGGCSDGRFATGQVTGSVTVDGSPLPAGRIIFKSDHSRMAVGRIEEGQILGVTTYEPDDGAPVGEQGIEIQPYIDEDLAMRNPSAVAAQMRASKVAMKYRRVQTSGLTANIERGDNELSLELKSKP